MAGLHIKLWHTGTSSNMNPMRSSHRDIEDFGSAPVKRETSSGPRLWNYVTAVLVIVVVVTIPILFVMVSNVKTDSKNVSTAPSWIFYCKL